MTRTCDFYCKIDWTDTWDLKVQHEPLLCFVCLPYSVSRPQIREREKLLDELGGLLLSPQLSEKSNREKWNLLRKLLVRARSLCPLPSRVL